MDVYRFTALRLKLNLKFGKKVLFAQYQPFIVVGGIDWKEFSNEPALQGIWST